MQRISISKIKQMDKEIREKISPNLEKLFCRVCGNVMEESEEIAQGFHKKCSELIEG